MPTVTGQALLRLHPTAVTVLGGSSAVSDAAAADIAGLLAIP
ncbi:MAG TPA: hypothetical protein VHK28_00620 [Candidatus Limnocylindria bacterium]|nr:hypothetical protein [Candidatus Limnocylindria bacterium]